MSEYSVDSQLVWVMDLETDNYCSREGVFSATPYYKDNWVVAAGVQPINGDTVFPVATSYENLELVTEGPLSALSVFDNLGSSLPAFVVGHNVRYDWQFIEKHLSEIPRRSGIRSSLFALKNFVEDGSTLLWDTQFVEHLLTGQDVKMISLDDLCERYGIKGKLSTVSELWEAGHKTRDIDEDILIEYLIRDVECTSEIFQKQLIEVQTCGMMNFVLQQLRSLFVVSMYERNGMYVNTDTLESIRVDATDEKNDAEKIYYVDALNAISGLLLDPSVISTLTVEGCDEVTSEDVHNATLSWLDIQSPNKNKQLVFGGTMDLSVMRHIGKYKSGKRKGEKKFGKVSVSVQIPPLLSTGDVPISHLTPKGKEKASSTTPLCITSKDVSLDDNSLRFILKALENKQKRMAGRDKQLDSTISALECLSDYRDAHKLLNTYCAALETYTMDDGLLHGNLNMDNTPTGRLTSSSPNLQNFPSKEDSDIKSVFESRFHGGSIGTVDFKQLEVVGLAWNTGDPVLIEDLMTGQDIHYMTGGQVFGWKDPVDMEPDKRKEVKRINFGTIYGAGAGKLSLDGKLEESTVRDVINALKGRYCIAFGEDYLDNIRQELDRYAIPCGRNDFGVMRRESKLIQPTGRHILFRTMESKWNRHIMEWPYTYLRNYPIQSIAADIVACARVLFWDTIRELGYTNDILMINEVHDEIVFDIRPGYMTNFHCVVTRVQDKLPRALKEMYQLEDEFTLPLILEVGIGENWKAAK